MLPIGSIIGILGGGQLGRMLAIAAAELGYKAHIYTPEKDSPAAEVAAYSTVADYHDAAALEKFAKAVDVITFEFENIPFETVSNLSDHNTVYPNADVLRICQNRLREKDFVRSCGIETAPYWPVRSLDDLQAIHNSGCPCILKTTEMGYDGKGQVRIDSPEEAGNAWQQMRGVEAVLEGFVNFRIEISVLVVRGVSGETAVYTPVQNIHKQHILHQTIAPAPIDEQLSQLAKKAATTIADKIGLVGILAVEMFITEDNRILINELAPRPHNSGHWTIDACITSQFEQTIRAVSGMPLGSPERLCDAIMTNLIGDDINNVGQYTKKPDCKIHLYGKSEARAGRKMGHVTQLIIPGAGMV